MDDFNIQLIDGYRNILTESKTKRGFLNTTVSQTRKFQYLNRHVHEKKTLKSISSSWLELLTLRQIVYLYDIVIYYIV